MKSLFRLDGKVALVTGGAGGIGRMLSLGLSHFGAMVVVASRNYEAVCKAAAEIQAETGNETFAIPVDVTDEDSVIQLVKSTTERMGTIDILVNSMGIASKRDAFDFPLADWNQLFNVNVNGTMLVCKHVGRVFKPKRQGVIINMSSVRGLRGLDGGNAGYCSSKGAVELLTKALALEWAPYNIRVNAIGPALIITPITIHIQQDPTLAERYKAMIPMGRLGQTQDCVGACIFLASPAADFISGQTIYIDGGLTAK